MLAGDAAAVGAGDARTGLAMAIEAAANASNTNATLFTLLHVLRAARATCG